jgi:hypothetical protein
MNSEVIDLALIVAPRSLGVPVVSICAADSKADSPIAKTACLTLDSGESLTVVDDQVVARVLSERDKDREPSHPKREHHGEGGPIADLLWMVVLHIVILDNTPDGYDDVSAGVAQW